MRQQFELVLQEQRDIAPSTRHFVFKREGEEGFDFIPGQFITLLIPHGDKIKRRSYSIANYQETAPGIISFAAAAVEGGIATDLLFNLKPGESVTGSGPFGRLILKEGETPKKLFLVATGTGVTPYRSMIPEIEKYLAANPDSQCYVFLGVRTPEHSLYHEDFLSFAKTCPNFEFHAFYSRVKLESPKDFQHEGHVQAGFDLVRPTPGEDIVYLCGNPAMIDEAFEQLTELGFDRGDIRREKYISSN